MHNAELRKCEIQIWRMKVKKTILCKGLSLALTLAMLLAVIPVITLPAAAIGKVWHVVNEIECDVECENDCAEKGYCECDPNNLEIQRADLYNVLHEAGVVSSGDTLFIKDANRDAIIVPDGLNITIVGGGVSFEDVSSGDWFMPSVMWAVENGLMSGTSTDPMLFDPHMPVTRGMLATVLFRLAEKSIVESEDNSQFSDVVEGAWYHESVQWVAENGIIPGYADGTFGPLGVVTREQLAAILYRYALFSDMGPHGVWAVRLDFEDVADISDSAAEGVMFCYMRGVINGRPGNVFDPLSSASRAEFSAMMHRLITGSVGGGQADDFTLEDLKRSIGIDAVFAMYSSVRVESGYYDYDPSGEGASDLTKTSVFVRRNGVISRHDGFDDGYEYTIELDGVYFSFSDGSIGKYAFFGDGYFENYYLPYLTQWIDYFPTEGERIVSVTVENGVRVVVIHIDVADEEQAGVFGAEDGFIESVYELDAVSGLQLGRRVYAVSGDARRLIVESRLTYGQDDDFAEPEYLLQVKSPGETRTVRFIMPDGDVITHVLPKNAVLYPVSLWALEFYEDPGYTVPFEGWDGDYPDEAVLYVKIAGSPETLVLYTSMRDSLIMALAEDFQSKNPGIAVETRIDGAGSLMAQIESERGAGRVLADVIWTSEIPDFYYMRDEGLLLQYSPAGADKALNPLEDTGGYFLPARLGTMGIAYNTDIIKTPPESWSDLTGPDYKDRFAIADPETSGTALMGVVTLREAFGEGFFRDLRANGARVGQSATQIVEAVVSGELAACLAVDYITFDRARSGAPIAIAYPQEMIVIPSPVAIFKDSPNAGAARKFLDYLMTPAAQQIIAGSGTLPILDSISVPAEFNIPPVAEAMARAIELNDAEMLSWKDEVVRAFLDIMRG